jgi:vitamin B12 transporter
MKRYDAVAPFPTSVPTKNLPSSTFIIKENIYKRSILRTLKLILAFFFISPLLFLSSEYSLALADTEELKEIKVTSSRDTFTAEDFPGSLSVFTEEEIKKKQYTTVEELLRGQLGLDVVRSGSLGSQTSIFMRAQGSASTLVIIDGVQANANTTGAFDFGRLSVENIERIEILRGPQSIQWGADASGGVINITTKRGKGARTHSLFFEGGSFGTFNQALRSSGGTDDYDYSVSASLLHTEGISSLAEDRGGRGGDGTINKTMSTKLGYNFTKDTRIEFIGRGTHTLREFDNSFSFKDRGTSSNIEDFYVASPFSTNFGGWWDLKITPSMAYSDVFSIGETAQSAFINRTILLDMQNNVELNRNFSLLFGGEYQRQQGESPGGSPGGPGFDKVIDNEAFFLQGIYEYNDRLVLTGGFRNDIHSVFGDKLTYKFDGGYNFKSTKTRLHTTYSEGFRAPTLNDLFSPPSNGFITSNPNLLPETIKSFEIGLKQELLNGNLHMGLTFFNSVTTNYIQLNANFLPQNLGKLFSKGLETEIDIKLPKNFNLTMRHTWNDHHVESQGVTADKRAAIRRPKHKFLADLSHSWNNKLNSLVGLYVRSSATDTTAVKKTGGFTTVRAALSYQYNKNLKLTVRGENLLNEDYEEIDPFGTAGINGYGGFVYTFD